MTKIENRRIEDLIPDANNINKHTQKGHALVENSIRRRGVGRGILAAGKNTENPIIIAGNLTHEKARDAGIEDVIFVHTNGNQLVVTVRDDLDPTSAEAIALGIEDNEAGKQSYNPDIDLLAAMSAGDNAVLSSMKKQDKVFGDMLEGMGLKEESHADAEPQFDRAAELLEKWQVKTGDLWQIGEHRLICGDCTDAAVVERVMGGGRAQMCLTDPPYGANIEYATYDDNQENLKKLVDGFLPLAKKYCDFVALTPGIQNIWLYGRADWIMGWFYGVGTGRTPYGFTAWQPILIFGKDPKLSAGEGCHPDGFQFMQNKSDMDERKNISHIVPKPLSVWERWMERLSNKNTLIVYEPFCGSGTTIVACENLGRKCRAVEISPAYVAVTLERVSQAFPSIAIQKIE